MNKEKRRVPKLRFPGFTEDWEQRKLSEVVTINPKTELPDEFKYVDLESVVGTNLLGFKVIKKENAPSRAQRLASYGDVFYQTVRPYQRNNYLFENVDKDVVFSTGYAQLRSKLDSYFLLTLVQNDNFVKVVLDNCTGTSYPAINGSELGKITVQIPSNEVEANQIGKVFRGIDKSITLHQRKLEHLNLKKKALLQKLFPKNGERHPELRFPGFTDAWEQRKLESLFTKYEDKVKTPNSGYWRLGLRSHCKGTFHTYVDAGNELETAEMNRVQSGNFILNITFAWERALAVTNEEDQDKLVSHRFPQFKPNRDLAIDFFKHTLMDKRFKHHLELSSPGGAGRNKVLKIADMLKYELLVPSIKEQNEISSFLNNVDYIITLHQRKLEHLQLQKKALLQQMFV